MFGIILLVVVIVTFWGTIRHLRKLTEEVTKTARVYVKVEMADATIKLANKAKSFDAKQMQALDDLLDGKDAGK